MKEYLPMRKERRPAMITFQKQQTAKEPQQINRDKHFVAWGGFMEELGLDLKGACRQIKGSPSQEQKGRGFFTCSRPQISALASGNCFQSGRSNHCYLGSGNDKWASEQTQI
ncbi:hypothetical protein CEXT_588531 [Caerostris extrusa]|uniref:Uncharacterized protein n=1 Tax=Caerostris extrusa TaxID=172846 RepID=A0AAV4UBA0_CAEEX|nr:hypothetical protein CEXT_588531 [Caerostris extrusa]